jgi:hypothetical protein
MPISDHNNGGNELQQCATKSGISSLADLIKLVSQSSLSRHEIATICSAIRTADRLVGHGALDLPADGKKILSDLERYSPVMAGMSRQALANLKSRLRKAFRIASPHLIRARSRQKLNDEWLALQKKLDTSEQRNLSRFFHFASMQGWSPQDIADGHVERLLAHLRDDLLVVQWENVVRQTIGTWNKVAARLDDLGLPRLTRWPNKRTPYWVDPATFAETLQADITAFLNELSSPALFSETSGRKLQPGTICQYSFNITALVSALVADGLDLAVIDRLGIVVSPENLKRALQFLHRRAGESVTPSMLSIAVRAKKIAHWCKLTEPALGQVKKLVDAVKAECPRRRTMTRKNRVLVDRLDDVRFRDNFFLLPKLLIDRAARCKHRPAAASMARTAIAAELLTMCTTRRENLIELELEKDIRRIGDGPHARWVIDLREEQVKNAEPLRFTLPKESAELLEHYLKVWRPLLCQKPTSWLFPDADGNMLDPKIMTEAVKRHTQAILGVPITPHQFRQLDSELYLREDPRGLTDISHHLGHRDYNTARRYYTTPKQRSATRRYQECVILKRSEAATRQSRRRRRQSRDRKSGAED